MTSLAVGLISNGDVIALARDTSTVDAHVGQTAGVASTAGRDATVTTTGVGESLGVKATLTSPVRATTDVLSISLGVSNSKIRSTAESTPTVRVYAGDRGAITAAGDVELAGSAFTQVFAKGSGVSGTVGVAASGAEVTATLNPTVRAFTERTGSLSGRDVKLSATLNVDTNGNPMQQIADGATHGPAFAKVTLGSGALLGGVAGGLVTATNSPTIEATVGASTTVTATRDVAVTTNSYARAEADGRSLGVAGGIGIGTVVTLATAAGTATTAFDGTLTAAASLTVLGTITARSDAIGRAVGGAIVGAFTKPTVRATTNPTVTVRLGGNVTASGAIVAKSDVTSAANAIGSVFTVSLLVAVSSVDVTATDSPTLRTSVPAGSIINGGSISIGALHNFPYPASVTDPTRGAHASADVEGGGTISVGDTNVNAVANANVDTTVAATATLRALALAPGGTIEIVSRSGNIADARIKSRSGGAINVNIINPTATATGTTTVSMLGNVVSPDGGAGARELSVLSEGESIATSNLDTKAGGAIQVTASSAARASSTPTVRATIGTSGAVIRTLGDLTVKAAGITDADSSAQTATGGFVNVQSFAANASTQPTVAVNVGADARLGSGATITIAAVHNESPPPQSDGTFTAPGAVDTANGATGNKITFALPHGLGSGDVVTYDAQLNLAGNTAIGGLTNGRQYAVIVSSPTALQFGAVFTSAQVDTTRDTVRFGAYVTDAGGTTTFVAGAHNLLDGDSVYYFAPAGGTAVGGLVSGQRYIVNVVDSYTLKLLLPGTVEKAVSLPASQVAYDAATNVGTINAANTFAEGDAVTYHAPPVRSFGSGAVELAVGGNGQPQRNPDNTPIYVNDDTIFLGSNPDASGNFQTGHGFATGDQITYTVSGGNLNTVFGTAYAGPRTLFVIRIDQFRIRLADSLCHATGCADPDGNGPGVAIAQQALALNPDRSASGLRATHSIVRASDGALVVGPSLTPLVDGQVYFVRNATAGSFQLALTPGGAVLGVRNGGLTGGPHGFAIEGVNLTSAGSGEQKLVLDLTSAGNGAQRLDGIGSGDTLAGAPSGDLIVTASGSGSGGGFVDVKSASSTASVDTRLTNTISAGAVLSGLDVVVRTDNRGNVASISTNGGGGFVSIGSADTSASLVSTTTLTVAAGATLTATRNLTVDAGATAVGNATAGTNSAGLGSGVHANASLTLRYTTTADIAGTLTAGADLTARSHTAVNGNASATAQGGGLGVDTDATATVTVDSSSVTRTYIRGAARLTGERVEASAIVDALYARSYARSRAEAFGARSDANATVDRGRADRGADRDPDRRGGLPALRQPGGLDPGRQPRRRSLHARRLRLRVRLRRGLRTGQDRRRDHRQGHGAQRVLHRDRRPDGRRQPDPRSAGSATTTRTAAPSSATTGTSWATSTPTGTSSGRRR